MIPQTDLTGIKGNNFNFLISYFDQNNTAISATFDKIEFKIFKTTPSLDNLVLYAGLTGVTYSFASGISGLTHDITKTFIKPNKDENNTTTVGSIYFDFQADVMNNLPAGRHFYNVEVIKGTTFSDTLCRGRFDLTNEDGGLI